MSLNSDRIADETLFGFLMNSLPDDQQVLIANLCRQDEKLRVRIEELRELVIPLQESVEHYEPRAGLVSETLAFVESQVEMLEERKATPRMSCPLFESSNATRLAWLDSVVALAAGVVLLSVLLPTVWYSRESARQISCASNMRELGAAFTSFANMNFDRRLPQIDTAGPLSFAGVYAIRLKEAGLLPTSRWLWCPNAANFETEQTVPSLNAYMAGTTIEKKIWQTTAGGNLSYNLGNWVGNRYVTPKMNGNAYIAVMGDTFSTKSPAGSMVSKANLHLGDAANVLYDDGRIQVVRLDAIDRSTSVDHPYFNNAFQQAPGIGLNDSCLGPSYQSPLSELYVE
jgi:hypothetical protein